MTSQQSRETRPYGHWPSPLSAADVFSASESVGYLRTCRSGLFFVLSLPQESNIFALMHRSPEGKLTRVSPPGFNVRSKVHEYGGLAYAFSDEAVFYCNFRDQCVMKQSFCQTTLEVGEPQELSPGAGGQLRYADFLVDAGRQQLICVREDHRDADSEPVNSLVAIDISRGGEGRVLYDGSDFVSSPALSPDGSLLAFQAWSHPNMPWDSTRIHVAQLDEEGMPTLLREIAGDTPAALVQLSFNAKGDLYFMADWSNWWNLYRLSARSLHSNEDQPEPVFAMDAEFCPAQWQLGLRNYDFCDDGSLLVTINRNGLWQLARIFPDSGELLVLDEELGALEHISHHEGQVYYLAASTVDSPVIARQRLSEAGGSAAEILYRCASTADLSTEMISRPSHLTYATADGQQAYGIFYAPCNPACLAPEGSLPPLLVLVHGGPTGNARLGFNPAIQFWTSRGFAVIDVNHRGSTGYGRRFRHSLYGQWGLVDVEDVEFAVQHLIEEGVVDANRVVIRGGSAGGYVVLAALVKSRLFSAGASYYGIGDLEMLAADTHKFESRYLDQLIGPWPQARQIYRDRSPLWQVERIEAAVLLLQGQEDKVVPPNQAEAMYEKLRSRNPATRYINFPDEGHGFRKPANQIRALEAELSFYLENLPS